MYRFYVARPLFGRQETQSREKDLFFGCSGCDFPWHSASSFHTIVIIMTCMKVTRAEYSGWIQQKQFTCWGNQDHDS